METIGQIKLCSFFTEDPLILGAKNNQIRKGEGHPVTSFLDLATKMAELQFMNRDHVLLFRGQSCDHRNSRKYTSLKPSLFRPRPGETESPDSEELVDRFGILRKAEHALIDLYTERDLPGLKKLRRQRILRWSLLQHYEVCRTPLLDVTHSLRIAASFASVRGTETAYIFVLGVPNLSGAITASAEGGLQIIRLGSVCPPSAVRPHIQEGYLLGEYPEMVDFEQKANYQEYEVDFGRRLIAKFRFNPAEFWTHDAFPLVSQEALYPNASDPIFALAGQIKQIIDP